MSNCQPDIKFPSYLDQLIKEIEDGNDKSKKQCACSLKVPRKEDGCAILDENDKAAGFNECLTIGNPPESGIDTNYPFSINLSKISKIYWQGKKWKMNFSVSSWNETADCGRKSTFTQDGENNPKDANIITPEDLKERICSASFQVGSTSVNGKYKVVPNKTNPCEEESETESGGSFGPTVTIDLSSSYLQEDGTFWPHITLGGGFSLTPVGATKVRQKLPNAINFKIFGEKLPKVYYDWSPTWHGDASWNWTGGIVADFDVEY
jgi:hypothetical protein